MSRYVASRVAWTEDIRKIVYPDKKAEDLGIFCCYHIYEIWFSGKRICPSRASYNSSLTSDRLLSLADGLGHSRAFWGTQFGAEMTEAMAVGDYLSQVSEVCEQFTGSVPRNRVLLDVAAQAFITADDPHIDMCKVLSLLLNRPYKNLYYWSDKYPAENGQYPGDFSYISIYYPDDLDNCTEVLDELLDVTMRRIRVYAVTTPDQQRLDYITVPDSKCDTDGYIANIVSSRFGCLPQEVTVLHRPFAEFTPWYNYLFDDYEGIKV